MKSLMKSILLMLVIVGCGGGGGSGRDTSQDNIATDMANAKLLEVGKPYDGNFYKDYTNWVKMSVTKGTKYLIETTNLGESTDTVLYLYDTSGDVVLRYDDDSGVGDASRIVWTAPSNGVYYIKVLSYENKVGATLSYTLTVNIVAPLDAYVDLIVSEFNIPNSLDEIKSFDNIVTIKNQGTADINNPFYVGIYISSDNDITISDMLIGYYRISSLKSGASFYSYDTLLSIPKDATELISTPFNIASAISSVPSNVFIDITLGESYYVGVICDIEPKIAESDELNNASVGSEILFALPQVPVANMIDTYEEDDTNDSATDLDSSSQYHNFYDDSVDWFVFFGDSAYEYTIDTQPLGIIASTNLSLYDSLDNSLMQGTTKMTFRPDYNSYYYLKVESDANQTGIGTDYLMLLDSVKVGLPDDYEDGNSSADAHEIIVDESQNHNFYDNAVDWAKFRTIEDKTYLIAVDMIGSGTTPILELFDIDGTTKLDTASQVAGTTTYQITWRAPHSDTYYIKVSSTGDAIGDDHHYRLSVLEQ